MHAPLPWTVVRDLQLQVTIRVRLLISASTAGSPGAAEPALQQQRSCTGKVRCCQLPAPVQETRLWKTPRHRPTEMAAGSGPGSKLRLMGLHGYMQDAAACPGPLLAVASSHQATDAQRRCSGPNLGQCARRSSSWWTQTGCVQRPRMLLSAWDLLTTRPMEARLAAGPGGHGRTRPRGRPPLPDIEAWKPQSPFCVPSWLRQTRTSSA